MKDVFDSQLDPVKGQALYMQRPRRYEKKHTASDGSCDNNSVISCNMFKYCSTASHLGNETARTLYKRKSVHKSPNRRANPFQPSCSTKIDLKSSCDVVLIPNTNTWALDTSTRLWLWSALLVSSFVSATWNQKEAQGCRMLVPHSAESSGAKLWIKSYFACTIFVHTSRLAFIGWI